MVYSNTISPYEESVPGNRKLTRAGVDGDAPLGVQSEARPAENRTVYRPDRRFIQRVSVLSWTVAATVSISLFLRLPTAVLTLDAFGSPVSIRISETTVMAVFIALLTASGTERAIRTHPLFSQGASDLKPEEGGRTWLFWGLPAAVSILAVLLAPQAGAPIFQVGSALLSGGLITVILFNLYATADREASNYPQARIFLNLLAYASALALFLLVYQARTRSLLSGPLIAATAAMLTIELLRDATPKVSVVLSYAALVAVVLGEVAWALNYWPSGRSLPGAFGGLLLLLVFYVIVGPARHALHENHLSLKLVLEYLAFGLLALVLIALIVPRL